MKKETILGKKLLVFTAHPDDEGLVAGTMYKNHLAGGETFLICSTYGEKGKSHLKRNVSDSALKKIRRRELLRAARVLRIDKVIFWGLPDGMVRENAAALFGKFLSVCKKIKPDYILSFGPEGISAHWDHITVGKVALKAARRLGIPLAAFTLADEMRGPGRTKFFLRRRKFGRYAGIPKHRKADMIVKVDPSIKKLAMSFHKSQFPSGTPFARMPKRIRSRMLGYEHFVREKITR